MIAALPVSADLEDLDHVRLASLPCLAGPIPHVTPYWGERP
jgi:hypothetical protein